MISKTAPKLSARLQFLHDLYRGEEQVWDVGCDHGLLGLSLWDRSELKQLHLLDPAEKVMTSLKNKLNDSYISTEDKQITLHHNEGQNIPSFSPSSLVYTAGMGGKLMAQMYLAWHERGELPQRWIVSPHRDILKLRELLHTADYGLESEWILEEQNQFYEILVLSLAAKTQVSLYGESLWQQGQVATRYRQALIAAYQHHRQPADHHYFQYLISIS